MGFVGRKKIILYPKDDHEGTSGDGNSHTKKNNVARSGSAGETLTWHYGGCKGQQYNTSPIDIYEPDLNLYPNFGNAPEPLECVLHPGDILYIPKRWWHHVTSLDTAVSVNVWWR